MVKDFYKEIDEVIKSYENFKPYHTKTLEWAADRVEWCWKWKKITEAQMEELAERITIIYKGE